MDFVHDTLFAGRKIRVQAVNAPHKSRQHVGKRDAQAFAKFPSSRYTHSTTETIRPVMNRVLCAL